MQRSLLLSLSLALIGFGFAAGQETKPADSKPADNAPKITYDEHIKPIFREHCLSCHNQEQKKGGLSLDSYAATMVGGSSGEIVIAGDLESSRLFALTSHKEQPKMPPMQDRIATAKLDLLQKWIEAGALENSGSKAVIKKKNSAALAAPAGKGKPTVVAMPENLWREPIMVSSRAGAVTALASSPWGPLAAVAGQRQIVLYNTDNLECVGVLPFTEGIPQVLKFSRNGSLLLAAGGRGGHSGSVVLFDVKTGKRVAKLGDELDAVTAADINDAHTLVALGSPLKMVRIFSVETGEKLFEMKKHTDWVNAVEFSPDGVLLATADRSGGVFVWESATAREYLNLRGHNGGVYDVAWRPDSNMLATAGEDSTVKLWELNDGNVVKSWNAHGGGAFCVDYTHDGRLVSCGRDKNVRTWTGDGTAIKAYALPDDALRCSYSHDGKLVLGGDWSGNIKIWDTESAAERGTLLANPPTLKTRLAQAQGDEAKFQQGIQTAQAELQAAQKLLDDRMVQLKAVETKLAATQAEVNKLNGEREAAMKLAAEGAAQTPVKQKQLEEARAQLAQKKQELANLEANLAAKTKITQEAAAKAAADKTAADKLAAEKPTEATAAVEAAKQAQAAAEKAEQERVVAADSVKQKNEEVTKVAATEQQANQAFEAAKKSAEESAKRVVELTTAAQNAAKAFEPLPGELAARQKEKAEAEAQLAPKKAAADAAQANLAAHQQRIANLTKEIAAFEQAGTLLQQSIAQAQGKMGELQTKLAPFESERVVAEKVVAEKAAAAKVIAEKIAALTAEHQAAVDAQKQAEAIVAEKAKMANEVKALLNVAQEAVEQAQSNWQLFVEAYPAKK